MSTAFRMRFAPLVAWGCLCLVTGPANGLTINRHFFDFGLPPASAVGGGNIEDIVNAAADLWERAILDEHTVDIIFGFAPLSSLAQAQIDGIDASERITNSTVSFDNDGSTTWYMDSTPYQSEGYQSYSEVGFNSSVGLVNIARKYSLPITLFTATLAESWYDMFTLALHEIGHGLGIATPVATFTVPELTLTAPRPLAGLVIPTAYKNGAHLVYEDAVMEGHFTRGVRLFPSAVDILAVAQVNNYTRLNLNPRFAPEPGTLVMLGIAAGLLALRRVPRSSLGGHCSTGNS